MKSFLSYDKLPYHAIALGKFDGMHKAHLRLLELLGECGAAISIASVNPPFVVPPNLREHYSHRDKYGRVPFYRIRFDCIKDFSAKEFLELLFSILPNLRRIVVGYDFCFGKNRSSSVADIRGLLDDMGKGEVDIVILQSQKHNDMPIHTSIIKELIKYGDMESVSGMLGRFYEIRGIVIKGQGIGSTKLYPTINIRNSLYVIPKFGVYATFSIVKGVVYKSVSFVGVRVSTDSKFCIETHIIDDEVNVESKESICIRFVEMIRNNQKFDSLEKLKSQIQNDIQRARDILTLLH